MENTGSDLLDPAARIHKAAEQIARSEGRVSGKVLQSGPGDRAWNALAFGVDRKCKAVPIPPRLRRKYLIPSSFHVVPKIHVSLSLKKQVPNESAVKERTEIYGDESASYQAHRLIHPSPGFSCSFFALALLIDALVCRASPSTTSDH
jgi:hypothetical protein